MAPNIKIPDSYTSFTIPGLLLSHHPESSQAVTPIIIVKLHRPAARNGFTIELADSLVTVFDTLSIDPRVKCVIITSSDASNRFFCVGLDLSVKHEVEHDLNEHRDMGGVVALSIYRCNKPVIAAINGNAVGVGITMTLPANIRVISSAAKVGFVFGRRGFSMDGCCSFFLPRLVGASRALHLITTGAVFPAGDRIFGDLFSEVVEPDQVLPKALSIAEEVAANVSPVASRVMKDMIYRTANSPEQAHIIESKLLADLLDGKDAKAGIQSFLQKRQPDFKATMEEDCPRAYPWWTPVDIRAKSKM
jgi:enoyl-CoA hydratase/carnithine racemase